MSTDVKNSTSDGSGSRKIGLSCAECRRSKLKCDRVFPCQSCIRRGCAGICPEGTLAATKGNKVLMAHAQRLSEQVKALTHRIHELEAALAEARPGDEDTHPLLRNPLATISDSEYDDAREVTEALGSLSIGIDGQAIYHGESAGSEYLQDLLPPSNGDWTVAPPDQLDLPVEIIELMNAFPFGLKDCSYPKIMFVPYLPPKQRALEVAELYYANVAWMYDPIARQDFMSSIMDPIYGLTGYASVDSVHSHRLAVFFILLANGWLYDSHPSAVAMAKQYHALSRAALSMDSVLYEATCATIQCLFLVFRFIYNLDRTSNEERWLLTGLTARLAQTIGLQRDSAGWNLPSDEIQRRRRIFWELFTWESWSSLVNGRPASLLVQHTDCQFPDDLEPDIGSMGEVDLSWHAWKFRYSSTCLTASAQHVFSTRTPPYSSVLDLDKKLRKFPLPIHLRSPAPARSQEAGRAWSSNPSRAMQQYCALCLRESNLLYIHRSYFAQAIRQDSENPLRHKFAPSVIATYKSACRLIASLKGLYPIHTQIARHSWFFWSGIFSSCIVLGALVVESPGCALARDALRELEETIPFYEEGSRPCRAPTTMTILQKLCQRAGVTYASFKAGMEDASIAFDPNKLDELEVLGGRKTVINSSSNMSSPSNQSAGSPSQLHPDVDDGNSPASQSGAAEMLIEYYKELGNPQFEIPKRQDYEMEGTRSYVDISYAPSKPLNAPLSHDTIPIQSIPTQSFMGHYSSSVSATMHPDVGNEYVQAGRVPMHGSACPDSKQPHVWQAVYQPPASISSAMPYNNISPIENHSQYRFPENNQDQIWRNFMLDFGGTQ